MRQVYITDPERFLRCIVEFKKHVKIPHIEWSVYVKINRMFFYEYGWRTAKMCAHHGFCWGRQKGRGRGRWGSHTGFCIGIFYSEFCNERIFIYHIVIENEQRGSFMQKLRKKRRKKKREGGREGGRNQSALTCTIKIVIWLKESPLIFPKRLSVYSWLGPD